jgi:hypothetical protein
MSTPAAPCRHYRSVQEIVMKVMMSAAPGMASEDMECECLIEQSGRQPRVGAFRKSCSQAVFSGLVDDTCQTASLSLRPHFAEAGRFSVSKPYVFVNDRPQSYHYLRDRLLAIPNGARPKFDQLNPYLLNNVVMPGEVVVVGDGPVHMCTPEETQLMQLAHDVRMSMIGASSTERGVMVQNFDLLQSIMPYGSIGIGASTGAWRTDHQRSV